jgi:Tfp pilus assembly protein PilN
VGGADIWGVRAVNLLPPDLRGASKTTAELSVASEASGGAGPFVVLGVLAACVAGATGYVLAGNTVKQHQAELATVTAQQQVLARRVAALKPYADFDAQAKSRTQTVRDLASARFDWQQVLGDLGRAVPANVTLSTLSGDVNADTGSSNDPLRSAIAAPAVTIAGCAPSQTDVARLMARLRDVDGVTRVSLSKSEKPDTTVTAPATSGATATGCGVGRAPVFDIVAFFERSHVPATLGDVTAGGSATPTSAAATPTSASAAASTTTAAATPAPSSTPTTTP